MAIRWVYPAISQVEAPRERHDVRYQRFDPNSVVAQVQGEGMFLSTRGAKHGVFARYDNATDWQSIGG
jgi:hypothetical protein